MDLLRPLRLFLTALLVACGLSASGVSPLFSSTPALAGQLTRESLAAFYPPPFRIGDKDDALPLWPIFKQNGPQEDLIAYVFESVDLAPIPGFSGAPIDILVALKPDGSFGAAHLIAQNEPVFVDGLGEEPLRAFISQYEGKSIKQNIKIGAKPSGGEDSANAYIDGVAKATASVRVVNETMLSSALQVARAKLGYAANVDPTRVVRPKEVFAPRDVQQLEAEGFLRHYKLTNREVEQAFAGSGVEGLDEEAVKNPDGVFFELYLAYLNAPIIGKNLFGDKNFERLNRLLHDGDQAFYLLSTGRFSIMAEDFVPGSVFDRIGVRQNDLPMDARDLAFRRSPSLPGLPAGDDAVLKIFAGAGFDPSLPARFILRVTRDKGQLYPEHISRDFAFDYALPASLFVIPEAPQATGWRAIFLARAFDLSAMAAALLMLGFVLAKQDFSTKNPRNFAIFRWFFLSFTLFFIGWRAQAQLSIVNLVGLVKAARGDGGLGFLLYDPPSLMLWAFILPTLVIWGRGAFCGWLCPFGALQEAVAALAGPLKIRQRELPPKYDRPLRLVKYVALIAILGASLFHNALAEKLADIEPFKTAITLVFVRSWPFVAYAVLLLTLNLVSFKPFCRYLCPLGAGLAVLGRARRFDWIPRRKQCGTPCQLCTVRCRYGAIDRAGKIDYPECFQCLDCVAIHNDPQQCVPLVIEARRESRQARKNAPQRPREGASS